MFLNALIFLFLVLPALIVYFTYRADKASGMSREMILRRCGITLLGCGAISVFTIIQLQDHFSQYQKAPPADVSSASTVSGPDTSDSQVEELPIIDYAEILRDSEAFDGKEVRVAGRIASFTTNSDEFTFRDRLGFLSIASDFEVRLSQRFSYGEDIWDYYVKNQYVLVQGIWSHSTSFPELRNAEVIATGEEARQADQAFTDAWKAEKSSYSNLPITDYMDLAETPEITLASVSVQWAKFKV